MVKNGWCWKVVTCWIVVACFRMSNGLNGTESLLEGNVPSATEITIATTLASKAMNETIKANSSTTTTTTTPIPQPPPPLPVKPHIILMVADDLGWNDVSWNNPGVITPNLGELASNGVILNQSYVLPTCTPTRAALLTGRYPHTIGMQKGALKPLEPIGLPTQYKLLPQPLKRYGYSTHIIGKWHLGFCSWSYTPTKRGFDTFYGFYTGAQDYYTHKKEEKNLSKAKKKSGKLKKKKPKKKKKREKGYLDLRNNTRIDDTKDGIYSTYLFASAAEEIIERRDPKKPMFLYLPFQSVHAPLQVPENYSEALNFVGNDLRRHYLGMVMAMDDAVGRVVNALKKTGHYDNSVIIFTTDNGGSIKIGASNYPLRGGKSNLLEGGTRGPAFVHSPLLPNPGTVSNQLFHVTDWYSTLVALAGGKSANYLDSINQWNAIAGYSNPPRTKMVYNVDDSSGKFKAAVRWNDMKLSVGHVGSKSWAPIYPIKVNNKDASSLNVEEDSDNRKESESKLHNLEVESSDYDDEEDDEYNESFELTEDSDHYDSQIGKNPGVSQIDSSLADMPAPDGIQNEGRFIRGLDAFATLYGQKLKDRNSQEKLFNKQNKNHEKVGSKGPKNSYQKHKKNGKPDTRNKNPIMNKLLEKISHDTSKDNVSKVKNENKTKSKNRNQLKDEYMELKKNSTKPLTKSGKNVLKWKRFKRQKILTWDNNVLNILNTFLKRNTNVRLYNITADPGESNDIAKDNLELVQDMMYQLSIELYRYEPMKPKIKSARGHPQKWNNVWSPGWCVAQ